MAGQKMSPRHFNGGARLYGKDKSGLANILRSLAQQHANTRTSGMTKMTDNSTGTPTANMVAEAGSSIAAFTETGTASATKTSFDASVATVANAQAVISGYLNTVATSLGMPLLTNSTGGTITTPGTVPAITKATTAGSALLVDVVTGRNTLQAIKRNMKRLVGYTNRLSAAAGGANRIADTVLGNGVSFDANPIEAVTATGGSVSSGTLFTISKAAADAEFTAIANNIASIVAAINANIGNALAPLQIYAAD